MDFDGLIYDVITGISSYARAYPIAALLILLVIAFFVYRKPGTTLILLALGSVLALIFYAIMTMGGSGTSTKERLIKRGNVPDQIFRGHLNL